MKYVRSYFYSFLWSLDKLQLHFSRLHAVIYESFECDSVESRSLDSTPKELQHFLQWRQRYTHVHVRVVIIFGIVCQYTCPATHYMNRSTINWSIRWRQSGEMGDGTTRTSSGTNTITTEVLFGNYGYSPHRWYLPFLCAHRIDAFILICNLLLLEKSNWRFIRLLYSK